MKLECIVTLANRAVRLRFLAMERSLRGTGCDLPLRVIPYDDERFELPPNATWWEVPEIIGWTRRRATHPTMRKYQCLTTGGYQFVDADVCFLRNPADVLRAESGFVTSCGHWHNPAEATTPESAAIFRAASTTWQREVFNTGQFACDQALFTVPELLARAESPEFEATCTTLRHHEQPGVNLLVFSSGVPVTNLTLKGMQSTWAGDYPGEYRSYWKTPEQTPYLIHWAGTPMQVPRPINAIFLDFLTAAERREWEEQCQTKANTAARGDGWRSRLWRLRRAWRAFRREWR